MTRPVINADGLDWPIDTFIDAYGFTRVEALHLHAAHPLLGRDDLLQAVTASGELIADQPARHLPWGEVIAIKARDGGDLDICDCCGSLGEAEWVGNGRWCDDCLDGDWFDEPIPAGAA